ncbi:MAG: PD-(D/E)XK nuclease family protein [Candidatus Omnitrophica bacterium]|nr:PD-(D/E)XK nuclease family protein [Candidatus Omnitrophota bacterium]
MSQYYRGKRTRNIYIPGSREPFRLSRSRIELFIQCPRCFYIDRRLGVDRPPGFPFALNSAVDTLLKKEFDILRKNKEAHPLIKKYNIDAKPAEHPQLEKWRINFKGVTHHHQKTNLIITGAIDDLWQNSQGEYIVVDYKSTSKNEEIIALNKDWQDAYKRQMEIYQWLLKQNLDQVSDTGYFVYCNGRTDLDKFDGKLEFDLTLIPYQGSQDWVEEVLFQIQDCLNSDQIPVASKDCDFCLYRDSVGAELEEI